MEKITRMCLYALFYYVRITSFIAAVCIGMLPAYLIPVYLSDVSEVIQVFVGVISVVSVMVVLTTMRMMLMQLIFGAQDHRSFDKRLNHWFAPHRTSYQRYNLSMVVIHGIAVALAPTMISSYSGLWVILCLSVLLIIIDGVVNLFLFSEDVERELRNQS